MMEWVLGKERLMNLRANQAGTPDWVPATADEWNDSWL